MSRRAPAADDAVHMDHALRLGRRGLGNTGPNPAVGAVVVRDGLIVGRGFTQPGGRPHAEAVALAQAGEQAVGATLYVTLEPCAHRSVRGAMPCVEAVLRAGIRRVVSAMDDPNPHIAGVSHALLRSIGIDVRVGVGGDEARLDHRGHVARITRNRPFVQMKMALTADGCVAGEGGARMAITQDDANRQVHIFRLQADAIMVGSGTAAMDDPLLTCRLPGLLERSPVRLLLDGHLSLATRDMALYDTSTVPTWVLAREDAPLAAEQHLRARGVEVLRFGLRNGRLDIEAVLHMLATRGITRLLIETGPHLAAAITEQNLADEVILFRSPRLAGDKGVRGFPHGEAAALSRFRLAETHLFDPDTCEIYRPA